MVISIVGAGAAGNKAAITLIEEGVETPDNILLVNSTLRDVPENYRSLAIQFENSFGGCGKEREKGGKLLLGSLKNGQCAQRFKALLDPDTELVIVISSTEGGTGSGSAYIIAKYYRDVLKMPVLCFGFTGFEDDGRGLQNTIEYFQDMREDYIVQAISNKKFLDNTSNRIEAQKAANKEFAERIRILKGMDLIDCEQNIDEMDLYKVAAGTPGYMIIGKASLAKLKSEEQFAKIITDMINSNKSIETNKSAKRLAIILNAKEETRTLAEARIDLLKDKLGFAYEVFLHDQYDEDQEEYIAFIASGMKMPLDEVQEVYDRYKENSEKTDKSKDSFFDIANQLKGNDEDGMFNVRKSSIEDNENAINSREDDFFKDFQVEDSPEQSAKKMAEGIKSTLNTSTNKEEFINTNFLK